MGLVTFLNLRNDARDRADMEDSTLVSEDKLKRYVNASIKELYDILISKFEEDYYMSSYDFTTSIGVNSYALPSDFYKLRGVDWKVTTGRTITLKRYNFSERNYYQDPVRYSLNYDVNRYRYKINGSNIEFVPRIDQNINLRLHYAPIFTDLVDDGDTFDAINGFEEYVVIDAAIKMLRKEESDTTELKADKLFQLQRIEAMADNRDANEPNRIYDTQKDSFEDLGIYV